MSYALVWAYTAPSSTDKLVVIPHPGTWADSETEAKDEGRAILANDELSREERDGLMPLAVVEVSTDIADDIQEKCEEVEVGTDLLFYDLDNFARWQDQPWWPKS